MVGMLDPATDRDYLAPHDLPAAASEPAPLEHASDEYLATVHRGVFLVLAGIVGQIIFGFGMLVTAAVYQWASSGPLPVAALAPFIALQFVAGVTVLWGWWLTSSADPDVPLEADAPQARLWVRTTTIIQLVISVAVLIPQSGVLNLSTTGPAFVVALSLSIISTAAMIAAFFAQMVYVVWLGERIPNMDVVLRARKLMWLGPVLYTFGLLLLGLGPLIALVLYWNMLEWVRKDLKQIRAGRGSSWNPQQLAD